ncbi:PadR family transcriptional regulator [Cryobacterium luteum]|uniref:PadR family transcriptional regulator n=1 Tax=Cryobacterium luteum TaxID=1424661 RepID=A0A1H8M9L6_9MICO|nr:PadR family transcriptional regulator [Cryobacterium luteum]TFB82473.1 PadR family transcriptional regulator [Cryobacterium luteum]SEO14077.1 PadR family transcriptional regulator, regulatory protein PadR [Cryobacterium luteum]
MKSEHPEEVQLTSEWPSDWMRAVLGMFALRALEQGASYGYAIIADFEANGLGTVKGGTLYPLLSRYESAGFVSVEWRPGDAGPGRKYFSLTDRGRSELERTRSEWLRFTANGNDYLDTARTGRTDT